MTGLQEPPICDEAQLQSLPSPTASMQSAAALELGWGVGVGDGQGDGTSVGPRPFDGWNGAQL